MQDELGFSDTYYDTVSIYSELVLEFIEKNYGWIITHYHNFIINETYEKERSRGEYCIELLTLGMLWRKYSGASQNSSNMILNTLSFLDSKQNDSLHYKNEIDKLQEILTKTFITSKIGKLPANHNFDLENFKKLLSWLRVTGEFKQEVNRLNNWLMLFSTLNTWKTDFIISSAIALFDWFSISSQLTLGKYTEHLKESLHTNTENHGVEETTIFTGKEETEYHLNMVGAEIINKGFQTEFEKLEKRVLLVPGCLRFDSKKCTGIEDQYSLICNRCNEECRIACLSKLSEENNFDLRIIPNHSGFSKSLKKWQNASDTGLIAAACLPNLVTSGYEIRNLDLKVQLMPLDCAVCRKFPRSNSRPTNLNIDHVIKFMSN